MRRLFVFVVFVGLLSVGCFPCWGAEREVVLKVKIVNGLTGREMVCPAVEVYRLGEGEDSVKVESKTIYNETMTVKGVKLLAEPGNFVLYAGPMDRILSYFGAEVEQQMKLQTELGREAYWFQLLEDTPAELTLPDIRLSKKGMSGKLAEVQVTASKVMFYHRGDTLVYNADAFVLAQGSMLDALIGQMPGVELSRNGVITVNGRKVDNLLLNGKDLFNGDKLLMLENLGAYTVKEIAVYDKLGRRSELAGADAGDGSFVMDVRLKREYAMGGAVNAKAGAGSSERWMARLFGTWFSENVSITAHANANNLNDSSTPAAADGFMLPSVTDTGERTHKAAGVTYFATGQGKRWEMKGDVNSTLTNSLLDTQTSVENYLSSGNRFRYGWNRDADRNFTVKTSHTWFAQPGKRVQFILKPELQMQRTDRTASNLTGQFTQAMPDLTRDRLERIYAAQPAMTDTMIYAAKSEMQRRGNGWQASVEGESDVKIGGDGNLLTLRAATAADSREAERFNGFDIHHAAQTSQLVPVQKQYIKESPADSRRGEVSALFTRIFSPTLTAKVAYCFNLLSTRGTYHRYNLPTDGADYSLGNIPPQTLLTPMLDVAQSYDTRQTEHHHRLVPSVRWRPQVAQRELSLQAEIALRHVGRNLAYRREAPFLTQRVDTKGFHPEGSVNISYTLPQNIYLSAGSSTVVTLPDMIAMVDAVNTSDPLNEVAGNPALKPQRSLSTFLNLTRPSADYLTTNSFTVVAQSVFNAFSPSLIFNPETGVSRIATCNVNGNRSFSAAYTLQTSFGHLRRWSLETKTELNSAHVADITAIVGDVAAPTRHVVNITPTENLTIGWHTDNIRIEAKSNLGLTRYLSNDRGFTDFTAFSGCTGLSGVANLPRNWSLSTDLNLYTRRGYADARLNTSDLVWNARLSRSLLGGALTVALDGYDLLHQLSNVTYTVNAQARTETVANVVPSYLLLHLSYRFNRNPRR